MNTAQAGAPATRLLQDLDVQQAIAERYVDDLVSEMIAAGVIDLKEMAEEDLVVATLSYLKGEGRSSSSSH